MTSRFEERSKILTKPNRFEERANVRSSERLQEPVTLKGAAGSYGSGVAGGAGGVIPDVLGLLEPLTPFSQNARDITGAVKGLGLKGTQDLTKGVAQELGVNEPQNSLERILQQSGEFGGQEALIGTGLAGPIGGAAGLAHGSASGALYGSLKELGLGDKTALGITTLATVSPIAAERLITKIKAAKSVKGALNVANKEVSSLASAKKPTPPIAPLIEETERFSSGLTKPRIVGATNPELAMITSQRQRKVIGELDKEASGLIKKSIEKRLPLSKEIEAGRDFEAHFDKGFGELESLASKHNPSIDIAPISELTRDIVKKYHGIPSLDPEARKIVKEVEKWRQNPQTSLKNLLKNFRSNNRKRKSIIERAHVFGPNKDYSNFLGSFNKAIVDSISKTLPEDSAWLKEFNGLNKEYAQFRGTQATLRSLDPFLKGDITPGKVRALIKNPNAQKKLQFNMGKEGADEVIQIAKDLNIAHEAIKKIPKQKIRAFDEVFPIGLIIPFVKIPVAITKVAQAARKAYGYWLTTPAKRVAVDQAIKAISESDLPAYTKATEVLNQP